MKGTENGLTYPLAYLYQQPMVDVLEVWSNDGFLRKVVARRLLKKTWGW